MSVILKLSIFILFVSCFTDASPVSKNKNATIPSYLREGDIRMEKLPKSLGEDVDWKKWPAGVVAYEISSVFTTSERNLIRESMDMITTKTGGCITFVARSTQTIWLSIISEQGCWSYVGKIYKTGQQQLSIDRNGCVYKGTIVHELCHAIGFWHEHNRPDRDSFVTINYKNINADTVSNFDKYTAGSTFSTPYDYFSIMHYAQYAFSINGQKTVVPIQNVELIPAYDKTDAQILSDYDIQAIRTLYKCYPITPTTKAPATTKTTTKAPVTTKTTTMAPVTDKPSDSSKLILLNDYTNINFYLYNYKNRNFVYSASLRKNGGSVAQETNAGDDWILFDSSYRYFSDITQQSSGKNAVENEETLKVSDLKFYRW